MKTNQNPFSLNPILKNPQVDASWLSHRHPPIFLTQTVAPFASLPPQQRCHPPCPQALPGSTVTRRPSTMSTSDEVGG
jgi:hypothetical protein